MSGCSVIPSPAIKLTSGKDSPEPNESPIEKNTMTTATAAAKSSVLNLRVTDEIKTAIAAEAIRDGRSMSQIAERALKLGLAQMLAPTPAPQAVAPKAPKAPAKGKGKGKGGK